MSDRFLLYQYKGNACEYCGTTVEEKLRAFRTYACFELHHIDPTKKSPDYDNLIRRKLSAEQLDEVDKCALLCGNCHDTLHGQDLVLPVEFTLIADGVEAKVHVLQCSIIYNYEKSEATVFSDDLKLLELYTVKVGAAQPLVLSGLELKPLLDELTKRSRIDGTLVISTLSEQVVYRVDRVNESDFEIEWNLDFPLVSAHFSLAATESDSMTWYLRSGHVIVDNQKHYILRTYGKAKMKVRSQYRID